MSTTRAYDFNTGPETGTQPDPGSPSADEDLMTKGYADANYSATVTTTRGDLIRRGASADERFAAVTDNRVVRGDGTDVVLGQIDDPDFFTSGAEATTTALGVVKKAVGASAQRTDTATIANGATIAFEDEIYDEGGDNYAVSGVYTCPTAGRYLVIACIKFSVVSDTGSSILRIEKNATVVAQAQQSTQTNIDSMQIMGIYDCSATDTLEISWSGDANSKGFRPGGTENYVMFERLT